MMRRILTTFMCFIDVNTFFKIRYVHYFQEAQKSKIKVIPSKPLNVKAIKITGKQINKISRITKLFFRIKGNWSRGWI